MRTLLVAAALSLSACTSDDGRGLPGAALAAVDEGSGGAEGLALGFFEEVAGARHLRAELRPEEGRAITSRSESGYGGPARNVLFYDIDGREGRWLFPDSRRAILGTEVVGDSARVRAFTYVLAEADTDDDGRIDGDDARTLALSDPGGRRVLRVAEGIDEVHRSVRIADDTMLFLVEAGGRIEAVEVGLDSLRVVSRVPTPPVPPAE